MSGSDFEGGNFRAALTYFMWQVGSGSGSWAKVKATHKPSASKGGACESLEEGGGMSA